MVRFVRIRRSAGLIPGTDDLDPAEFDVKSLAHLARNASTALRDPEILQRWIRYQWAARTGHEPALRIGAGIFRGFPHFNAYLGAWKYRPDDAERHFLACSLRGAKTVLDVGANFGVLTALMCELAPDAQVYAFEPHPQTFAALQRNTGSNALAARVHCVQGAVGASVGTTAFLDTGAPATNRIVSGGDHTFQVALTTVDVFCQEHRLSSVDFLKIDVEGAERNVLAGAAGMFGRRLIRCGMIEICPGNLKQFGKKVDDLHAFFATYGYELFWFGADGGPIGAVPLDLPESFLGNAGFRPAQPESCETSS